jgi:hypothetical protein
MSKKLYSQVVSLFHWTIQPPFCFVTGNFGRESGNSTERAADSKTRLSLIKEMKFFLEKIQTNPSIVFAEHSTKALAPIAPAAFKASSFEM